MIELQATEADVPLLDEPFLLRARSAGADGLVWRARYRDDDGRAWKAQAAFPERLSESWFPSSSATAGVAALGSLRPVGIDVRVEAPDGRSASRTLSRLLLAPGVKRRRWREAGLVATLHLPAGAARAAVVVPAGADVAAALLASRGLVALTLVAGTAEAAADRLASMPAAAAGPVVVDDVPVPPNVGAVESDPAARAAAWDALLARLGAAARLA